MGKKRSKNLDDATVEQIVQILDNWHEPKLTWDLLIGKIMKHMYSRYTRQALSGKERIQMAFDLVKQGLDGKTKDSKRRVSKEFQMARARIETMTAENSRLRRENDQLLEQFCRWAYNATNRGLSVDFLNQPLPTIDRGQTKEKKFSPSTAQIRRKKTKK